MKSYVLRAGSKYTLVKEEPNETSWFPSVAREDMLFEDKELIEVDTVTRILHFKRGIRHYYANNSSVSVIH